MRRHALFLAALLTLPASGAAAAESPAGVFFDRLAQLCGQRFEGVVTAGNETDQAFREARLTMQVGPCAADEIRIPFHVGEDRARTWIVTRLGEDRLRLKHDHRHADGVEDELSRYGGDNLEPGTATRQTFPADAYSIDLFTRTGRAVSNTNVWALEADEDAFVYELARPGRLFRVSFDLNRPISALGEEGAVGDQAAERRGLQGAGAARAS